MSLSLPLASHLRAFVSSCELNPSSAVIRELLLVIKKLRKNQWFFSTTSTSTEPSPLNKPLHSPLNPQINRFFLQTAELGVTPPAHASSASLRLCVSAPLRETPQKLTPLLPPFPPVQINSPVQQTNPSSAVIRELLLVIKKLRKNQWFFSTTSTSTEPSPLNKPLHSPLNPQIKRFFLQTAELGLTPPAHASSAPLRLCVSAGNSSKTNPSALSVSSCSNQFSCSTDYPMRMRAVALAIDAAQRHRLAVDFGGGAPCKQRSVSQPCPCLRCLRVSDGAPTVSLRFGFLTLRPA